MSIEAFRGSFILFDSLPPPFPCCTFVLSVPFLQVKLFNGTNPMSAQNTNVCSAVLSGDVLASLTSSTGPVLTYYLSLGS